MGGVLRGMSVLREDKYAENEDATTNRKGSEGEAVG
jgi:hypothetical protein